MAGALLAVAGVTTASVRLLADKDDASAGRPAPVVSASAARSTPPAPTTPFSFTFTGYEAGRFTVGSPLTVSTAYEVARIKGDAEIFMYLTVFRPGAFAWQKLSDAEPRTVRGRPALRRMFPTEAKRIRHIFAWEYADNAWATVTATSDAADDLSDADFTALAEGLSVGTPRSARLPVTLRYIPAGYRPFEVGMHAWAGLNGVATEGRSPHQYGGVLFARPAPAPTGLVDEWEPGGGGLETDRAITDNFAVTVDRQETGRKRTDGRVVCKNGFCTTWLGGGKVSVQVSSYGRLSDSEMRKVLAGVRLTGSLTDDTTWPQADAALRGVSR